VTYTHLPPFFYTRDKIVVLQTYLHQRAGERICEVMK
jgi:hypothetical protein